MAYGFEGQSSKHRTCCGMVKQFDIYNGKLSSIRS